MIIEEEKFKPISDTGTWMSEVFQGFGRSIVQVGTSASGIMKLIIASFTALFSWINDAINKANTTKTTSSTTGG